jgi:hypothetical protein
LDDDRPGSPAEEIEKLQFDDPRATDFRNYLRTWLVRLLTASYTKCELLYYAGLDKLNGRPSASTKYTLGYIGPLSMRHSRPPNLFQHPIAIFLTRR